MFPAAQERWNPSLLARIVFQGVNFVGGGGCDFVDSVRRVECLRVLNNIATNYRECSVFILWYCCKPDSIQHMHVCLFLRFTCAFSGSFDHKPRKYRCIALLCRKCR